jgi:hypothetical protein
MVTRAPAVVEVGRGVGVQPRQDSPALCFENIVRSVAARPQAEITLNDHRKGDAERSRDQESMQWVADLVCAILDAENIKRSSSTVNRPPGT